MRGFIVNVGEASVVATLFDLYDQMGSLKLVEAEAARRGLRSKHHVFASGATRGGAVMTRGMIHHLLTNPIYRGQIRHKDKLWPGQHAVLIAEDLWDRVQARLQLASARKRGDGTASGSLVQADTSSALTGKVRDETGDRLTPSHTRRHGRRLRYYVSNRLLTGSVERKKANADIPGWRLPAPAFEISIAGILADHLETAAQKLTILSQPDAGSAPRIAAAAKALATRLPAEDKQALRSCLTAMQLGARSIAVALDPVALAAALGMPATALAPSALTITAPFEQRRRGIEMRIVAGSRCSGPDPTLLRTLARAHGWLKALRTGSSFTEIATASGQSDAYIRTRIQLAFLSPALQSAILTGSQAPELSLESILRRSKPLSWSEQEQNFGLTV